MNPRQKGQNSLFPVVESNLGSGDNDYWTNLTLIYSSFYI